MRAHVSDNDNVLDPTSTLERYGKTASKRLPDLMFRQPQDVGCGFPEPGHASGISGKRFGPFSGKIVKDGGPENKKN